MLRVGISVEGPTEREFVNQLLLPYLCETSILITPVSMDGNISLDRIRHELPRLLGSFDYVSTFYDLYGFKGRQGQTADQLEAAISALVGQSQQERLIPYIQQYEFEALIFSSPVIVAKEMFAPQKQADLEGFVRQAGEPEKIDDGVRTCPSRRLKSLFPGYDKKLHGPVICNRIGLSTIRKACLRFDRWLSQIEALAQLKT